MVISLSIIMEGKNMLKLRVSDNEQSLETSDGDSFFYLADTVWSAFTNITLEEWESYLNYRKSQGFNVLQINTLQQWDASETTIDIKPFDYKEDGSFDFYKRNDVYFDRAEKMIQIAVDKGFVPALVLLWCNYVPDTWASNIIDQDIMPFELVEDHIKYIAKRFSKYNPIYLVSGDTDFPTERVNEYYSIALNTIKRESPDCLTTLHIRGRQMEIPNEFMNSDKLDFYMFQSGHNSQHQNMSYKLAEEFYNKPVKRPALNSEPCYEQMGYSRLMYGRYTTFDVRKAAWQSLLSGASAGITYGAHGIWSWHKSGQKFGLTGEAFDRPYDWKDALKFEGAWDYGFARKIFEIYNFTDLKPLDIIIKDTEEIRMASTTDLSKLIIYVPVNTVIKLDRLFEEYKFTIIDLEKRRFAEANVNYKDSKTVIDMHLFESDVLIVGEKLS